MSASSSVKHPSLLHTGAPVCQKNGRRLARGGGGEPQIRGSQPQGLVLHAAPWWSPPWPRLPAVRLPNPRSSTHPLHLLPVPSPSSRQHPLPLGPAPRRCHPRSGSLPARARRSGPGPGTCRSPGHGGPDAPAPRASFPLTSSRALLASLPPGPPVWSRFLLWSGLPASGRHFSAFSQMRIGGTSTPPPPRGDMEAIKWRTRK